MQLLFEDEASSACPAAAGQRPDAAPEHRQPASPEGQALLDLCLTSTAAAATAVMQPVLSAAMEQLAERDAAAAAARAGVEGTSDAAVCSPRQPDQGARASLSPAGAVSGASFFSARSRSSSMTPSSAAAPPGGSGRRGGAGTPPSSARRRRRGAASAVPSTPAGTYASPLSAQSLSQLSSSKAADVTPRRLLATPGAAASVARSVTSKPPLPLPRTVTGAPAAGSAGTASLELLAEAARAGLDAADRTVQRLLMSPQLLTEQRELAAAAAAGTPLNLDIAFRPQVDSVWAAPEPAAAAAAAASQGVGTCAVRALSKGVLVVLLPLALTSGGVATWCWLQPQQAQRALAGLASGRSRAAAHLAALGSTLAGAACSSRGMVASGVDAAWRRVRRPRRAASSAPPAALPAGEQARLVAAGEPVAVAVAAACEGGLDPAAGPEVQEEDEEAAARAGAVTA